MAEVHSDSVRWARLAVIAAGVVIAAHGLVHLMGVALLWKLGQPGQLRYADAVPAPGQAVAGLVVDGLALVLVAISWLRTRKVPS